MQIDAITREKINSRRNVVTGYLFQKTALHVNASAVWQLSGLLFLDRKSLIEIHHIRQFFGNAGVVIKTIKKS